MKKSLEDLKKFCSDHRQHLIDGVNILLEGETAHFRSYENVLKGHVCGRSTRVLEYLLESNGFDVKGYQTRQLGRYYPCGDHKLLVVNLDEEIIVDPAYYQFIDIFYLPEEYMPKEDIMIVPYNDLDEKIDEFVELRNLRLRTHPNPKILTDDKIISWKFKESDEELHIYFRRIWDYKNNIYEEIPASELKNDIKRMRNGGLVTELTRKLIEYLDKNNLIKE